LNQCTDRVEYHLGLDFAKNSAGVIICDEADELIFQAPKKFAASVSNLKCICLTATPDNGDLCGLEHQVLQKLGFSIYDSCKKSPLLDFDHTLQCSLTELVLAESKMRPVLVHCALELVDSLQEKGINFTLLVPGVCIAPKLDQVRPFPIMVTTTSFGLRGFDYRAPTNGLTLIIAKALPHERALQQALSRVGRYHDSCKRILVCPNSIDSITQL
jgi:hypothetical protein